MSIAGGLHLAFERAAEVGCDCLQVFVKNQRQWKAPALTDADVHAWQVARQRMGNPPVVAHDTYLINLASPDDANWQRSIDAITDELERCERLGISGLVAHPGAHMGEGEARGLRRIARAIDAVHRRTAGFKARILLESTAGQGTNLGHRLEHLARIIELVRRPERLGVCLDTCHLFAAGYDLCTAEGYEATIAELEQTVGLARVAVFHTNDSLKPLGSRRDRHAAIGQGEIGLSAFRRLVNDPRFLGLPMILETPKGTDERGRDLDRVNLARLRRLIAPIVADGNEGEVRGER
jgi:deoxyribonuclease IV